MLLSGDNSIPQERLYWSNDEDRCKFSKENSNSNLKNGVNLVKKKMSRNRFQEIKRYLHLADNNNLVEDDISKNQKVLGFVEQKLYTVWSVFSKLAN